jgi:hypothetical protein
MILKSMGRKSSSFGQVIEYITKEKEKIPVPPHLIFKHNLFGKTKAEIEQEFLRNEANRQYKRGGVNRLYHEWIAFHDQDRDKLTDLMLEDLARQYFKIRNENALFVAAVHKDKDHVHVHFLVSGTEISGKSLRISKQEFNDIKKSLQDYQIQKYPQLQHSISNFEAKSKNQIQSKEYKVIERNGKSDKQVLKEQLEQIYSQSKSRTEWQEKIKSAELEVYTRGKNQGIIFNDRNYRLNTLGFTEEKFAELDKIEMSMEELRSIRGGNEKQPKLEDKDIVVDFVNPSNNQNVKEEMESESEEKDENDIEINFYPRTNSFDLEI